MFNRIALVAAAMVVSGGMVVGCHSAKNDPAKEEEKHTAYHGGCLNALTTCAVGHAEIVVDGDVLKCWFVGGENQTDKAVKVSATQIDLAVTPDGGQPKKLTLRAKPSTQADESLGDCSYFEAQADWLAGIKKFQAEGHVFAKGQDRKIIIQYPDGYDPD